MLQIFNSNGSICQRLQKLHNIQKKKGRGLNNTPKVYVCVWTRRVIGAHQSHFGLVLKHPTLNNSRTREQQLQSHRHPVLVLHNRGPKTTELHLKDHEILEQVTTVHRQGSSANWQETQFTSASWQPPNANPPLKPEGRDHFDFWGRRKFAFGDFCHLTVYIVW